MEFSIDAPLMHYIARQILNGAVPYKDIIDMNGPGTYLVHMVCVAIFGDSEFGWRVFDLLLMSLCVFSVCDLYRGRVAAPIAVLALFFSWLFSQSYDLIGQRDLWACYLTFFALSLLSGTRQGKIPEFSAGLVVGLVIAMKPHFVLFCLPIALTCLYLCPEQGKKGCRFGAFLSGIAGSIAGILVWLWIEGGLQSFIDLNLQYNFAVYRHLQRRSVMELLNSLLLSSKIFLIPLMVVVSIGLLSAEPLALLWALGCLGAALCYLLQAKGWEYHQVPFVFFASLLIGEQFRSFSALTAWKKVVSLVCIAGIVTFCRIQPRPVAVFDRPQDAHRHQQELVDFLLQAKKQNPLVKVQVLDTAEGALRALLKADIKNATPYIYDFMFYAKVEEPVVQSMQQDFIKALSDASPDYIVQSWLTWLPWERAGYERIRSYPALYEYLLKDYQIALQSQRYRIYQKKHG